MIELNFPEPVTIETAFYDRHEALAKIERAFRLRETRDYLEGIVESSADIIVTVNRSGFIQTFNRGAEIALGYTRDEVVGDLASQGQDSRR